MKRDMDIRNVFAFASALLGAVEAVTCDLSNNDVSPVLVSGWEHRLIAKGFTKPRSIQFDASGNLLVLDAGVGLFHLTFDDGGSTCLDVARQTSLINSTDVSHHL